MVNVNNLEIKKEEIRELPKIDLSTITEVKLPNGHVYVKYNIVTSDIPVMLRIDISNMSIKKIIEGIQNNSDSYNSMNSLDNTYNILGVQRKYIRDEAKIIPIKLIDINMLNGLDTISIKIVSYYLKNMDNFIPKLKYINFQELLAINEEGRVITCSYDAQNDKVIPRFADVVQYNKKEGQINEKIEGSFENFDFEATLDRIENSNEEVEINGEKINIQTLDNYDNYPELIERKTMNDNARNILRELLAKYRLRKMKKEEQAKLNNPPKIRTLKINHKAFVSNSIITFLSGFTAGIILALVLFILIRLFK